MRFPKETKLAHYKRIMKEYPIKRKGVNMAGMNIHVTGRKLEEVRPPCLVKFKTDKHIGLFTKEGIMILSPDYSSTDVLSVGTLWKGSIDRWERLSEGETIHLSND